MQLSWTEMAENQEININVYEKILKIYVIASCAPSTGEPGSQPRRLLWLGLQQATLGGTQST